MIGAGPGDVLPRQRMQCGVGGRGSGDKRPKTSGNKLLHPNQHAIACGNGEVTMISEMKSNDFAWCPLARTFHAGWRAKASC